MEKNEYIKLGRKIFSRDPIRQHLQFQDDGSILNTVTGVLFDSGDVEKNILEAERANVGMPTSSVRFVTSTGAAERGLSAAALQSRVKAVNDFLSSASEEELRRLKLDRLIGKKVSGVQATFSTKGNESIVGALFDLDSPISQNMPGFTNITQENIIQLSLRMADEDIPLSLLEQSILFSKTGSTILTDNAVNNFFDKLANSTSTGSDGSEALKKISKLVGKIPKRAQSELAPRDIEFTTEQLGSVLRRMGVSSIGDIGKSLELTNIVDIILKMARGDELTPAELRVAKTIGDGTINPETAMQYIGKVSGLIGTDPAQNLDQYNVLSLLSEQIKNLPPSVTSPGDLKGQSSIIFKQLEKTIDTVKSAAGTDADKIRQSLQYEQVINSLEDNIKPARDGAVLMTESFAQNLLDQKYKKFRNLQEELKSLGPGMIDENQLDELRALEGQIQKLRQIISSGTTTDNTIRFGIGEEITLPDGRTLGGTIKAKAGVLRFENYGPNTYQTPDGNAITYKQAIKEVERMRKRRKELESRSLRGLTDLEQIEFDLLESETLPDILEQFKRTSIIGDISTVKEEAGTTPYLGMNAAMSSSEQVYVEPMELMAEPTLFTSKNFLQAQQAQIAKSQEGIKAFLKTGKIPEEVRALIEAEKTDLAGLDFEDLTPSAKGLVLKRRRELAEIDRIIALGLPLEESIPMINLVKSHFAKQAFTLKNDVPRLVVPSATRYSIRTPATSQDLSKIFADGGDTLIPIRTSKKTTEKATFVQFALDGDQMLVSNENTSRYKSVLSGFDLDDDTIFQLRTFQDESGKTRLASRIVRDPKSREEALFAVPRFDSVATLQGLLNKDPETITRLQSSMESDEFLTEIMKETGVDESTARKIFEKLKNVLAKTDGKFSYKGSHIGEKKLLDVDESGLFTLETIVRKAKEMERGAPIESFQDAAEVDAFERAAEMRSASTRSRIGVVLNDEGMPVTQQIAKNLSPEQAGPYLSARMAQITTVPGVDEDIASKMLKEINDSLVGRGDPSITLDELFSRDLEGKIAFLNAEDFKGIEKAARQGIVHEAKAKIIAEYAAKSVGDYGETIGSLANIAAGVESVSDILQDPEALKTLADSMSADAFAELTKRTTVPVEPRSNIVDIINQSIGDKELLSYDEAIKGLTDEQAGKLAEAYKAIAKQVTKRTGIETTYDTIKRYLQSDAAKAGISQQSEFLFAMRASQLAAGYAQEELVGFDPMVLSGRLKGVRAQIIDAAVTSYRFALANFVDDPEAQERIREELSVLERLKPEDSLEMFTLKKGSRLYNTYAATSIQHSEAQVARAAIDVATSARIRMIARKKLPTAKAEYIKAAREMIKISGLSSSMEELKKLAEDPSKESIYKIKKLDTSRKLGAGLRAIQDNYESTSSTTLDIVDAIESELRVNFGAAGSRLLGDEGPEGVEHEMMSLFELAKTRRDARRAMGDPASFGVLQRAFREHTDDTEAAIDLVDENYAKKFLDNVPPEEVRSKHLFDFMRIRAGQTDGKDISPIAQEAFRYVQGRKQLETLDAETAGLVRSIAAPDESDLDDIGRLADDIARSVTAGEDEIFEIQRSNYKRMSFDVFKSKNVRRGTVAAAALIGASFLYQSKKKKDHTAADIQGPPLLPGGNPYETGYPTRQQIISQMEQNAGQTYGRAMQYQINTTGSIQDLNNLRGIFGDVVDGPINSTMYNGLPIMGQDPYSDIASRF